MLSQFQVQWTRVEWVRLIAIALAAGAVMVRLDPVFPAVRGSYARLKTLVRNRLDGMPDVALVLVSRPGSGARRLVRHAWRIARPLGLGEGLPGQAAQVRNWVG
jgi:hypothetical protein